MGVQHGVRAHPEASAAICGAGMRAAPALLPQPEAGVVSGPEAVDRAVRRRFYGGVWRRPPFANHADSRLFTQQLKVYELMAEVPPHLFTFVLGEGAEVDVPSSEERKALVMAAISAKAGPEGQAAHQALRSWRLLQQAAKSAGRSAFGLPCGRALLAAIVKREGNRAVAAATGSQGGATVASSIKAGFEALKECLLLPIDTSSMLVEAAAAPPPTADGSRRSVKQSASAPACVQLHFETLARLPRWSPLRVFVREVLCKAIVQHTRLNDALNAVTWADPRHPMVIFGRTTTRSKDGMALDLFAPAKGWLGPLDWWPAHAAEMAARGGSCPDFSASGPKIATATTLKPGVLPRGKVLPAVKAVCAMQPLGMGARKFDELSLTFHGFHGAGADLVRYLSSLPGYDFSEGDIRAIGHWLRDKNAPQEQVTRAGRHTVGAANQRGDMAMRYTSGVGRIGERAEQLALRARLIAAVRGALAAYGRHWTTLPRTLEAWSVLFPQHAVL